MNLHTGYQRLGGPAAHMARPHQRTAIAADRRAPHGRSAWTTAVTCLAALAIVVGGSTRAAWAQGQFAFGGLSPDCFSLAAVAMTPYDVNIQQNQYRMTHEQVYHNATATGSILLYGPVHPWRMFGDGLAFSVTYKDPDGRATGSRVRGQLRHVGPAGIRIIATLDSANHAHVSNDAQVMSIPVKWSQVNDRTGYFVVRIYVERSHVGVQPAAFGYNLCSTIF